MPKHPPDDAERWLRKNDPERRKKPPPVVEPPPESSETTLLRELEQKWAASLADTTALGLATPKRSPYAKHEPTPKQAAALVAHRLLPSNEPSEVFYGGAAGGGKSDWLLDGALEFSELTGYAAIIFRRTYTDLALPGAIMARSKEWLARSDAGWNETNKTWTFASGATLTFAYLRAEDDKYRYQSAEFQYVGFDELTQFSQGQYTYLFSRLRRPAIKCAECVQTWPCAAHPEASYDAATEPWKLALSRVPLRMCSASNPGGIGHGWVKERFPIDGKPRGRRVFIPARLDDNPHLDRAAYTHSLKKLSPALAKQLLEGDWEAFEGQAYPDLSEVVHAVEPFPAKQLELWGRHEGMDHGVTNPTAWLLVLTDPDSNLIVADEYYAPGTASMHAAEILDRRSEWWEARDEDGYPIRNICWGDPVSLRESSAFESRLGDPLTLQDEYRRFGLALSPGNNRRRAGYVHLRELLECSCACSSEPLKGRCETCGKAERRWFPRWHRLYGQVGAPRLYVVRTRCPMLWKQLTDAPIAAGENDADRGEAVDRRWEGDYGHAHAALRYGLLSPERSAREAEELPPDDPREAVRWRRARERLQRRADRERVAARTPEFW